MRRDCWTQSTALVAAAVTIWAASAFASRTEPGTGPDRLNLEDARHYLLELINKDRASFGRKPVTLDGIASEMAQRQSELMVSQGDFSHVDLDGRLPAQRYTEAGGRDRVAENVMVWSVQEQLTHLIVPDPDPLFTRAEIESIEAGYFNEIPPNDGHRQNILRADHTHVGIGLARGAGVDAHVLGNAEEFVGRFADDLSPLPAAAGLGEQVTVRGRLSNGRQLSAVGISRGDLPRKLARAGFRAVTRYTTPSQYVRLRPGERADGMRIEALDDGRFEATMRLDKEGLPGLYYVWIWVRDPAMGEVLASQRTIRVEAAPADAPAKGAP